MEKNSSFEITIPGEVGTTEPPTDDERWLLDKVEPHADGHREMI